MKARMLLRSLSEEDVTPEYISWLHDPDIIRYLGIRHRTSLYTKEDVKEFLQNCMRDGRFHWGIFLDERHVGNVSCSAWSNENSWIDISFIIGDKTLHGQGVATFAVGAAMNHLFVKGEYNRIQTHVVVENTASIRVMEKLGMCRDAILRQSAYLPPENRFVDEAIYSALRNEWCSPILGINDVPVKAMNWEHVSKKKEVL